MAQPCNGISSSADRKMQLEVQLVAVEMLISRITQLEARHNPPPPPPPQPQLQPDEPEAEDEDDEDDDDEPMLNTPDNGITDGIADGNTDERNSTSSLGGGTADESGKPMSDVAFTKERSAVGARMTVASSSSDVRGHKRDAADQVITAAAPNTATATTSKKPKLREDESEKTEGSNHTMSTLHSGEETSSQRRDEHEQQRRAWERCIRLLDDLKGSDGEAWVFCQPVRVLWPDLPNYDTVVKRPMDLGTVRTRVERRQYSALSDYAADVRLTFDNAIRYNAKGSVYHKLARKLWQKFNNSFRAVERMVKAKPKPAASKGKYRPLPMIAPVAPTPVAPAPVAPAPVEVVRMESPVRYAPAVEVIEVHTPSSVQAEQQQQVLASPRSHSSKPRNRLNPRLGRQTSTLAYGGIRKLTSREMRKLSDLVEEFPEDRKDKVLDILGDKYPEMVNEDLEVELDLERLDQETLFTIYRLGMNWQKSKNKVLNKRLSVGDQDSLLQPLDSSDNVDIGGDSPVRQQQPEQIEVQQEVEQEKKEESSSSSSGGSSSDSETSTSGTDDSTSDSSSSDKESDGDEAAAESDKG